VSAPDRRALARVAAAGHRSDETAAREAVADADPHVRALGFGALDRMGRLADDDVAAALRDPAAAVRRRALELAARRPAIDLHTALHDEDPAVVEVAAWAAGEHERVPEATLDRLIELATGSPVALVREAAVAALGAIGDERALPAVLAACRDQPTVRRRAVLALAPFEGDEVETALDAALTDRDWQVRQAAEDLRAAVSGD